VTEGDNGISLVKSRSRRLLPADLFRVTAPLMDDLSVLRLCFWSVVCDNSLSPGIMQCDQFFVTTIM
jgi:hypothetical protein